MSLKIISHERLSLTTLSRVATKYPLQQIFLFHHLIAFIIILYFPCLLLSGSSSRMQPTLFSTVSKGPQTGMGTEEVSMVICCVTQMIAIPLTGQLE